MSKVSLKKAEYLLDEKLMPPKFRCGYQVEYAKVLLTQKIAEMRKKPSEPKGIGRFRNLM